MTFINFTNVEAPQQSRWERLDGQTAIETLDGLLGTAGLPDLSGGLLIDAPRNAAATAKTRR